MCEIHLLLEQLGKCYSAKNENSSVHMIDLFFKAQLFSGFPLAVAILFVYLPKDDAKFTSFINRKTRSISFFQ